MFGYFGRYLRIDPTSQGTRCEPIEEAILRRFLGGVGLGTWLLARESPIGVDPLAPDSALVIALSPLVGTSLTTSAKFAVVAISPITGRVCDSLSSSHFALAAKRSGIDGIVIQGAWNEPSIVFIDAMGREEPTVAIQPAGDLWGLPARDAEARIRERSGNDWQVASIGRGGEERIPFATISHDGRHAGRGGLGAVLGSKRIKAIAIRGDRRVSVADPAGTVRLAKELSARSIGPETEKYRELGTLANLLVFNRFDALPTRNFQVGHFEGVNRLAAEELDPARRLAKASCASCTIGCEQIYATRAGKGVRMEYQTLSALGSLCGVDDPDLVLRAAALCDEIGIDTITTGGTLAFLMECADRGWIVGETPSGHFLRFGDGEAVLDAIASIPTRTGIGALLAMGSRRASEVIGGEAPGLAMHVKGLELPGYDPRSLQTMALGLAVGSRGADHNRSGAYEADFSGKTNRLKGDATSSLAAIESEDRSALIDSLILCKFLKSVFSDLFAESATMLRAVTGWEMTGEELHDLARRVVLARRCLNQREGWNRAEDTLPLKLLSDNPSEPGRPYLPSSRLTSMIDSYYLGRGCGDDGVVGRELRARFGLDGPEFGL